MRQQKFMVFIGKIRIGPQNPDRCISTRTTNTWFSKFRSAIRAAAGLTLGSGRFCWLPAFSSFRLTWANTNKHTWASRNSTTTFSLLQRAAIFPSCTKCQQNTAWPSSAGMMRSRTVGNVGVGWKNWVFSWVKNLYPHPFLITVKYEVITLMLRYRWKTSKHYLFIKSLWFNPKLNYLISNLIVLWHFIISSNRLCESFHFCCNLPYFLIPLKVAYSCLHTLYLALLINNAVLIMQVLLIFPPQFL